MRSAPLAPDFGASPRAIPAPLVLALAVSVAMHALLIFGVVFRMPRPHVAKNVIPPLKVVLVNAKTQDRPRHADALAQANLDRGGDSTAKREATSPLPALESNVQMIQLAQREARMRALERQAEQLLTQIHSRASLDAQAAGTGQHAPAARVLDRPDAADDPLRVARLEAQISREWSQYQSRPRIAFIGARTRQYVFARYVDDWVNKVERVGNLNYPENAKRRKLHGSLLLSAYIRPDGTVERVEINRSSGSRTLDADAERIVRLAAPYEPFPAQARARYDLLMITRTWTFTHTDVLATSADSGRP
ncbi:MAG: energy transducer TonB [Betaproteobacteria bacterium]|nr:energy transducer TonB [Betaproteobacteria bacterium]